MLFTVDTVPNVAFVKEFLRLSMAPSPQAAAARPSPAVTSTHPLRSGMVAGMPLRVNQPCGHPAGKVQSAVQASPVSGAGTLPAQRVLRVGGAAAAQASLACVIPKRAADPSQTEEDEDTLQDSGEAASFNVSLLGGQSATFLARVTGPSVASVGLLKQKARKAFDMAKAQPLELVYNDKAMQPESQPVSNFGISEPGGTFEVTVVKKSAMRVAAYIYKFGPSEGQAPLSETKELFLEPGKPFWKQLDKIPDEFLLAIPAGSAPPIEGTYEAACNAPGSRRIRRRGVPEDELLDGESLISIPSKWTTLQFSEDESPTIYDRTVDGFVDREKKFL